MAPALVAAATSIGVALATVWRWSFVFGITPRRFHRPVGGWLAGGTFVIGCALTAFTVIVDQAFVGSLNGTAG